MDFTQAVAEAMSQAQAMGQTTGGKTFGGIALTVGLGKLAHWLVWPRLKRTVPPLLAGWLGGLILRAFRADGITDPDLKEWAEAVTLATVHLAEKKFPDRGFGPDRFQYAYSLLTKSFPWLAPFLASQGDDLGDFINAAVVAMDQRLKQSLASAAAAPPNVPPAVLPSPIEPQPPV